MLVEMGTNQFEPHCIAGGCDVVAQDCTGGLACGYAAVNNVVQRTCISPGTRQDGETCGPALGSCAAGLTCTGSSSGAEICKKYCASDAQCSGGARCASLVIVPDSPERPLTCEPPVSACDVLLQDCPSASDACYLTSLGTLCQSAGTATPGQTCNATTLCEKGSTCVPALVGGSVTYQCVRLCGYPSGSPTCSAGTCQQLATQAGPVLDGGVGACR